MEYLLLAVVVTLTAVSQMWQKVAALKSLAVDSDSRFGALVLRQRETWFAVIGLATSLILWLGVLYRMEVSKAFPMLSITLVLVMLLSAVRFGEPVGPRRWIGALLITFGVLLIGGS